MRTTLIAAVLCTMLLSSLGCSNKVCVSGHTESRPVQVCARYSDTGHCAHYTTSSQSVYVCDHWECKEGYVDDGKGNCVKPDKVAR